MKQTRIDIQTDHKHYQLVSKALNYLMAGQDAQPTLSEIASALNISQFHFQRLFSDWAGVSPKQFLSYLTKENAKHLLRETSILETSLNQGLSGPSRLHDLFVTYESMTPGEYKHFGKGVTIYYGVHSCLLGFCFIAVTKRGLCKLAFFDQPMQCDDLLKELQQEWAHAEIISDSQQTEAIYQQIFLQENNADKPVHLLLKGSPFRLQVWQALLAIPSGKLVTYRKVAEHMDKPLAVRAVASAIANNPIAMLIPCHRVIRSSGALNQYRWGAERKAAMIALEQTRFAEK